MLKLYKEMAKLDSITAKRERVDWEDVYSVYGEMAEDVRKLNTPSTVTDAIDPRDLENKWDKIRKIIDKLPDYERVYDAMKRAGCKTTLEEIGKSQEFYNKCVKYSPYMRRRITFLRLKDMINEMESML